MVFLSTPSARRATQYWVSEQYTNQFLSTPSARRATEELIYKRLSEAISIHALREEGDIHDAAEFDGDRGISIHALREEGDRGHPERCSSRLISIHALREEGDQSPAGRFEALSGFLSTPSARRATCGYPVDDLEAYGISIHALREEGDQRTMAPAAILR